MQAGRWIICNDLKDKLNKLSRMLYLFILTAKKQHKQYIH